jgi:hypothetical protein
MWLMKAREEINNIFNVSFRSAIKIAMIILRKGDRDLTPRILFSD